MEATPQYWEAEICRIRKRARFMDRRDLLAYIDAVLAKSLIKCDCDAPVEPFLPCSCNWVPTGQAYHRLCQGRCSACGGRVLR